MLHEIAMTNFLYSEFNSSQIACSSVDRTQTIILNFDHSIQSPLHSKGKKKKKDEKKIIPSAKDLRARFTETHLVTFLNGT